jgi:hypothetical protein
MLSYPTSTIWSTVRCRLGQYKLGDELGFFMVGMNEYDPNFGKIIGLSQTNRPAGVVETYSCTYRSLRWWIRYVQFNAPREELIDAKLPQPEHLNQSIRGLLYACSLNINPPDPISRTIPLVANIEPGPTKWKGTDSWDGCYYFPKDEPLCIPSNEELTLMLSFHSDWSTSRTIDISVWAIP